MVTAEQVLQITLQQLCSYDTFQQYVNKPEHVGTVTEDMGRNMARILNFDYENLQALNHLQLVICLGLPSPYTAVNISAQGFMMNDIDEVREIFSHHLPDENIVDLYEHGTNLRALHERSWAARRFVDMSIYLYCTERKDYDDNSEQCIGFPGMPNMDPLIAGAIDAAQRNLFVNGNWYSELVPVGFKQHMYRCIPDTSSAGSVIVTTDCGTVYLSGRPKRGDTNSNHLRPV